MFKFRLTIKEIVIFCSLLTGLLFWINHRLAQLVFVMVFILCLIGSIMNGIYISKYLGSYLILLAFMTLVSLKNVDIVRIVELPALAVVGIYIYDSKISAERIKRVILTSIKIASVAFALPVSSNQAAWGGFYCGALYNPDMLGYLESLAFCLILVQTHEYYWNGEIKKARRNLLFLCLNLVCCLMSQARIPIIGIIIAIIGLCIYELKYIKRNAEIDMGKRISRIKRFTTIAIVGVIVVIMVLVLSGKLSYLYTKMTNVSASAHRFSMHIDFIKNAQWFGRSRSEITSGTDSTFIYLLTWFGPFAAIGFYLMLTCSFIYLLRTQIKGQVGFNGFYSIVAMGIFYLQSLTSDMFYTAAMYLAITFYGLAMSEKRNQWDVNK